MGIVKKLAMGGLALAAFAMRGGKKKEVAGAQPREGNKGPKSLPVKTPPVKDAAAKASSANDGSAKEPAAKASSAKNGSAKEPAAKASSTKDGSAKASSAKQPSAKEPSVKDGSATEPPAKVARKPKRGNGARKKSGKRRSGTAKHA